MKGFVYLWENINNGKKYIGSHKGNTEDGYIGSGVYFKRAYSKNPKDFVRTILYEGDFFLEVEEHILKLFNAAKNKEFYNLKNEAVGGWKHVHNNDNIVKKRHKAISDAKKGKVYDFMFYDKRGENNPMYGKKHSEETKQKISKKLKGKKGNARKKVIELTTNTKFDSVEECANYYGVTNATMCVLIRNEKINKGSCKNKIFKYA